LALPAIGPVLSVVWPHDVFRRLWRDAFTRPPSIVDSAGGPNAFLQDPTAARFLQGCPSHKCYIDDINSFSTNEVTINWNSPLAWVAAWTAEQARAD
jgi:endoglucanase